MADKIKKRVRQMQAETGWSYCQCLILVRAGTTPEQLEVLKKERGTLTKITK